MAELSIDADVDLSSTAKGGRRRPIYSGFRPALWFGNTGPSGEPELHSVVLALKQRERLVPGEHGRVLLFPLAYETWPRLKPGMRFDLYDGARSIGSGVLRSTPEKPSARRELRQALGQAFEEWAVERFGEMLERNPHPAGRLQPDMRARFTAPNGDQHTLVGEIVARRPTPRDVDRLARIMEAHAASLGLVVALDEPSPRTLDAIYRNGTVSISNGIRTPRIRVITPRDLARDSLDLLPTKQKPEALELRAA